MWSCPQHLIMAIEDGGNDYGAVCNHPLYLIIYIGDSEGNIDDGGDGQWKTRRNGDDRWEMAQGQRRSTEECSLNREQRRKSTGECSHKKEWRPEGRHSTIKS